MKNVLFLGNSHAGAIKRGWDLELNLEKSLSEKVSCTFSATAGGAGIIADAEKVYVDPDFAQFQKYQEHFRLITGAPEVNFNKFDAIFIVGCATPLDIRLYFNPAESFHIISAALIDNILDAVMLRVFNQYSFLRRIMISNIPVFWIPNPCEPFTLNERLKLGLFSAPQWRNFMHYPSLDDETQFASLSFIHSSVVEASIRVCNRAGFEGVILPKPELLHESLFQTKKIYSVGSTHFALGTAHPDVDPHMNAGYGKQILMSALEKLGVNV